MPPATEYQIEKIAEDWYKAYRREVAPVSFREFGPGVFVGKMDHQAKKLPKFMLKPIDWNIDVSYKLDKNSVLSEPDGNAKCPSCKVPDPHPKDWVPCLL